MKKRIAFLAVILIISLLCVLSACDETQLPTGKSAYDLAVENGFEGSVTEWLDSLKGEKGEKGDDGNDTMTRFSNYDVAVLNGFSGSEAEWLESLRGEQGEQGKSAYETAVENGFIGSETEWLTSLQGEPGETAQKGLSAYEIAVNHGYEGTEAEWLESLQGSAIDKGDSAYDIAVKHGFTGTEAEWLASLNGTTGSSAYDIAVKNGFVGTESEWLDSLVGGNFTEYNAISSATSKAILSVVTVYCQFGDNIFTSGYSSAAGVIIYDDKAAGDAYIVTNYHVVYSTSAIHYPTKISVFLYGQEFSEYEMSAEFVGGSLTNDIAVIKITGSEVYKNSSAIPATIADSALVYPGDVAIAIGNPEADGISASSGIVSVSSEEIELTGSDDETMINPRVIRMDTPVNPGNSGGGLFNDKGELIGIVNAKSASLSTDDMGYAIPSNVAISISDNVIANCDGNENINPLKVLIGITIKINKTQAVYNPTTKKTDIVQEIVIDSINSDSSALGVLEVGDVVKSITCDCNGVEKTFAVSRLWSISDYIFYFDSNEVITMHVLRNGVAMDLDITLGTASIVA